MSKTFPTKAEAIAYYGGCAECGNPATYPMHVDGVALCVSCAAQYGLEVD